MFRLPACLLRARWRYARARAVAALTRSDRALQDAERWRDHAAALRRRMGCRQMCATRRGGAVKGGRGKS